MHKLNKFLLTILISQFVSNLYDQKWTSTFKLVEAIQASSLSNQANISSSLPPISERANGVNSRYLSAASTASLAAATVATSNGGVTQQQQSNNNNNNNSDANRNFLLHQQQQQQQQQQNQANVQQQQVNQVSNTIQSQQSQHPSSSSSSLLTTTNNNNNPSPSLPLAINQILPQFNNGQLPQTTLTSNSNVGNGVAGAAATSGSSISTPVMSTTYTFNPITNQFVPSDLTTGSLITPLGNNNNFLINQQQQQQQNLPFNNNNNGYALNTFNNNPYGQSLLSQQQQQQNNLINRLNNHQQVGVPYNQYGNYQQQQIPNQNLNQIINQQRQFNRRNGYSTANNLPNRFTINSNNYGQTIDDDGYFQLQQQQQQQAAALNNNNNNELISLNEYGGHNNYPYQTDFNHHHHHLITPQPSSVSSSIILPFTSSGGGGGGVNTGGQQQQQQSSSSLTSFNTAFTGPPNLIPFSEYRNDQCVAADGRHGTCYQASECIRKNGTPMGKCNNGGGGSLNNGEYQTTSSSGGGGSNSYVCCLFDVTCGSLTSERFVYFRNPGYPNTFDQSQRMCRTRIGKLDKGICQFRLDLLKFDVAKPTNGNCSTDMFVVSGQNENYIIPKICGLNDGQHYYVGVDESGIITLNMMMMGYYRRNFEILITQIPCKSDYLAPAHCLQYYMGTHGTIKSFNYNDDDNVNFNNINNNQQQSASVNNYDLLPQAAGVTAANNQYDVNQPFPPPYGLQFNGGNNQQQQQQPQQQQQGLLQQRQMFLTSSSRFGNSASGSQVVYATGSEQFGGYPNDLDYTMCIRKESGFCSITYQLSRNEQGIQPFAVGHSIYGNLNDSSSSFSSSNWQPVSTECRDDYLLIGGIRLCSGGGGNNHYPFDPTIQFSQNGTILNSAGININQQQQLQNQYNLLMQQLVRLQQQQQQQQSTNGNNSTNINTNNNNNLIVGQQQQQQVTGNLNNNLDQQQAAIIQQTMIIQQQLNNLAAQQQNNRYQQFDNSNIGQQLPDSQGTIITDSTSGPFILRFVSNLARNARGFHIDYRQNPCK